MQRFRATMEPVRIWSTITNVSVKEAGKTRMESIAFRVSKQDCLTLCSFSCWHIHFHSALNNYLSFFIFIYLFGSIFGEGQFGGIYTCWV